MNGYLALSVHPAVNGYLALSVHPAVNGYLALFKAGEGEGSEDEEPSATPLQGTSWLFNRHSPTALRAMGQLYDGQIDLLQILPCMPGNDWQ